ncbi:MAG: cytochrome c [Alphaproteobacteria bacterium]|nr:cytochrome c [Alphaproteobacteria bacterium]
MPARATGVLAGALALAAAAVWASPDPLPWRQDELIYRLKQDCGSCHGLTMKGGLGPALLPETLADKPDHALVEVILKGVPGTPMPPWDFEISVMEAHWLVRQMKKGAIDDR